MIGWNPHWKLAADDDVPMEQLRRWLDERLPGYTAACEEAKKRKDTFVTLAGEYKLTRGDAMLIGWAAIYAHHSGIGFHCMPRRGNISDEQIAPVGAANS